MSKEITKEEDFSDIQLTAFDIKTVEFVGAMNRGEISAYEVIKGIYKAHEEALTTLETATIERCIEALPKQFHFMYPALYSPKNEYEEMYVKAGFNNCRDQAEQNLRALLKPKKEN